MIRGFEKAGDSSSRSYALAFALGVALMFVGLLVLVLALAAPQLLAGALAASGAERPVVPVCMVAVGGCLAMSSMRARSRLAAWASALAAAVVLLLSVGHALALPVLEPLQGSFVLGDGASSPLLRADAWLAVASVLVLLSLPRSRVVQTAAIWASFAAVGVTTTFLVASASDLAAPRVAVATAFVVGLVVHAVAIGALAASERWRPALLASLAALPGAPAAAAVAMTLVSRTMAVPQSATVAVIAASVVLWGVVVWIVYVNNVEEAERTAHAAVTRSRDVEGTMRTLEAAAGVGVWRYQLGTEEVELSDRAAEVLMKATCVTTRAGMFVDVHPDDRQATEDWLTEVGQSQGPMRTLVRAANADGTLRWIEACGTSARDGSGLVCGTVRDVTAERASRIELEETVALLKGVAATVPDVDFVYDIRTNEYLYMNRPLGTLMGVDGPISGTFLEEHVLDEDRGAYLSHVQQVNRSKDDGVYEVDYRVRRDDGTIAWIKSRASVFKRAADGTPLSVFGTVQDVTESRRAMQLLREATERFERVSSQSPGVVFRFVLSPEGVRSFPYVSESVRSLLGVGSHEVMADPDLPFACVHAEDLPPLLESLDRSARSLADFSWVGRVSRDGEQIWVQVNARPSRLEDGSTAWDGSAIDVTGTKEAETAIQRAHKRIEQLLSQSPTVIYECGADSPYVILSVASNVRSLLGLYPEQVAGRSLFQTGLVHSEDAESVAAHSKRFIDHGSSTAEYRLRTVSGDFVWVRDEVRIVSHESGEADVVGAWTDISAQVSALHRMNETEERYQRMTSSVPGMVFDLLLHADGTPEFRYVSRGCYDLTGLAPEEIVARPESFLRLIDSEDKLRLYRELIRAQRELGVMEWQGTLTTTGRVERRVAMSASTLDIGTNGSSWTGFLRDATEVHAQARRLAACECLLDEVLAKGSDAVIAVDGEGRITSANSNVTALFGYAPTELVGQDVNVLVPEESRTSHAHLIESFSPNAPSRVVGRRREVLALSKSGSMVPVAVTVLLADRPDGTKFVGLFQRVSVTPVAEAPPVREEEAVREAIVTPLHEPRRPGTRTDLLVVASESEAKRLLLDDPTRWSGFAVTIATSIGLGLEMAKRKVPDVLLLVSFGPTASQKGVLEALRSDDDLSRVPVIVLDRGSDADARAALMRSGATKVVAEVEPGEGLSELIGSVVRRS